MEEENKVIKSQKNAFYKERRFWFYVAFFAVVIVFAISYFAFQYAIHQGDSQETPPKTFQITKEKPKPTPKLSCLTGVELQENQQCPMLYAVMVENHYDARPLSGLEDADMVFEFPVEGGITRFMAIFNSSSTAQKIGPVRSARPYYVEYARSLDAVYAHVGGSPEALNRISGLYKFKNLDEMANEHYFWRDKNRYPPHNAYTKISLLNKAVHNKNWAINHQPKFWSFIFNNEQESSSTSTTKLEANKIKILYGGSYNVEWHYDFQDKDYVRYQGRALQRSADKNLIKFKNIIILFTSQKVLDKKGRLQIPVNGQGKALIINNGHRQLASWHKKSGEFVYFLDEDNNEIKFPSGKTWLSFITLKNQKLIFE